MKTSPPRKEERNRIAAEVVKILRARGFVANGRAGSDTILLPDIAHQVRSWCDGTSAERIAESISAAAVRRRSSATTDGA